MIYVQKALLKNPFLDTTFWFIPLLTLILSFVALSASPGPQTVGRVFS